VIRDDRLPIEPENLDLQRERARARALRATAWWKRRVASGICHYCRRAVGPRALTLDHIVPLVKGGRSIKANVVPACKACNTEKQSLLPWEWDGYGVERPGSGGDS